MELGELLNLENNVELCILALNSVKGLKDATGKSSYVSQDSQEREAAKFLHTKKILHSQMQNKRSLSDVPANNFHAYTILGWTAHTG